MLYNKIYSRFCAVDIPALLCALALCAVSLASLFVLGTSNISHSISSGYSRQAALTQSVCVLIGLFVFVAILLTGQKIIKKIIPFAFAICLAACFLTLTSFGVTVDDDRAWLSFLGVSVQPSELLKTALIAVSALILSAVKKKVIKYALFFLCSLASLTAVFLQKDMGTLLIFIIICIVMLFYTGASKKLWAIMIILSPAAFYSVWRFILNTDQKNRILSAVDPSLDPFGVGYQQMSAKNAIASGGLTGRLFESKGSYVYVSSSHNDFMLSFIAQIAGSIGIIAVCLVMSVLISRISPKSCENGSFVYYIRSGIFAMLASQAVINTAMNMSLFPVIGIPLPFISAGGTAVISEFAALGLAFCSQSQINIYTTKGGIKHGNKQT